VRTTIMKLSLVTPRLSSICASAFALGLSLALPGCGSNDEPAIASTPPAAIPTAPPTAVAPATRTLVQGKALSTSPVNLVVDPGFGLLGGQAFGTFLTAYEDDSSEATVRAVYESRSPAGFGGSTARIADDDATDTRSRAILFLTSFAGGSGPFRAQVWVSRTNPKGTPVDETSAEAFGVRVSLTEEAPDGTATDLPMVPEETREMGGRRWVLLRGEVPQGFAYGGFLVIRTGTNGGQFAVAAPEVVPAPLLAELAEGARTRAGTSSRAREALTVRPRTAAERTAIQRYRSRPPRLVPAGSAATPRGGAERARRAL